MNDRTAFNRLTRARSSLLLEHPFFASLALRLTLREDCTCRDAWTDGRVFGYNPHYINMLPDDKLEGLTAHVVMHPACGHHQRRGNRDSATWNRACDYAINALLLEAGFVLPDGALSAAEYEGKSAEAIYAILTGNHQDQDAEAQPAPEENDTAKGETQAEDSPGTDSSDVEQQEMEQNAAAGEPGPAGEVRDDPGGGDTGEQSAAETDWEEALVQAAHTARDLGSLPAGLERLIENVLAPKICWQQLLAGFIERSTRSDFTWVTPNRRYLHMGMYLPAMETNELARLAVAVDTSGSIRPAELQQFAAEINAVMGLRPTLLHLLYCDMQVQEHRILQQPDMPVTITPKGGGGTDYRPVFELLDREGSPPSCLIYLTDLVCKGYPKQAPDYPVLWVCTGDQGYQPPFGEIIHLQ